MKAIFGFSLIVIALLVIGFTFGKAVDMKDKQDPTDIKYTLRTYTGVGSGVYKHGTIVKVVDGQPVVVGSFHDDSGKDYPGTVQIEEVE